jgi:hypothetical protein
MAHQSEIRPENMASSGESPLFQSMDQLRTRHGNSPDTKDRIYFWGGGILIGAVIFGLLYLAIHLLE